VKATLIRSYDTALETSIFKAFDINLCLRNNSKNSVTFWIYNCSWQDNFIINNWYINYRGDCPKNFPVVQTILPKDSLIFKALVTRYNGAFDPTVAETKFGFILIDTIKCKSMGELDSFLMDRSKQDIIIWSNPLYLRDIK
jgi:hypothetical protein